MTTTDAFLLAEQTRSAIDRLAGTLHDYRHGDVRPVADRLPVVLTDLLGVTVAGMRTPELRRLLDVWPTPAGPHPLVGCERRTDPDTAARLLATAACSQELDEGNKHAAGHPAAHVVPAALAAAHESPTPVTGERLLTAVAVGYEVAARFGRALRRDPAWHTHGHWGVTGAAAAAAVVHGCTVEQLAAAIDVSTDLMTVTPWTSVLAGDFARNLWLGQAAVGGLLAARLARAGLAVNRGGAAAAFDLLGTLDPDVLVEDLGERWLVAEGYLKQHAACSYTHPAVDLVQSLRRADGWSGDDVASVHVATHGLARPLLQRDPVTRLGAMFSMPFVVAVACTADAVDPSTMEPGTAAFERAAAFSDRVVVEVRADLDAHLPRRRVTEVVVELADGRTVALAQPDPIGDTAHFPLGEADVVAKIDRLLAAGPDRPTDASRGADGPRAADLLAGVRALVDAPDVVAAYAALPYVGAT
ncbi:MmgE/PrpD family protein [Nocardioides sp. Arc9.136]|uniref:MmgE/PrpD family protein n=1 Tax=Nocardioides sp. Arc9.136 TaxID=2996826 RepID=UPI002666C932|nr:MmgE/PrpD family protein [Nocardioides sp. Arc9.136]WKN48314.1 MmgE/PrpD family protein [Nocardioides sp. Arc9.136]